MQATIAESSPVFQGDYFAALFDSAGRVRFECLNTILAALSRYELVYGRAHNLRAPIDNDDDWIILDSIEGLSVGCEVEFRNELSIGRSNLPVVYRCRISEIGDCRIRVDVPPQNAALRGRGAWGARGCTISRRFIAEISDFSTDVLSDGGGTTELRMTGENEAVTVHLIFTVRKADKTVQLAVQRLFKADFDVFNESVCLHKLPPLVEVARKNRQVDIGRFQRRYNIEHQGVTFGNERRNGLHIYGATNACSIEIEQPRANFRLREITPFRKPPFDLGILLTGDLHRYASAPAKNGKVEFLIELEQPVNIEGVTFRWYKQPASAVVIETRNGDSDTWRGVLQAADATTEKVSFSRSVVTSVLKVILIPSGEENIITLTKVDILVGGADFSLRINLDDQRDHRYLRYLEPEQRKDSMNVMLFEMLSATRRKAGEVATTSHKLVLGPIPKIRPRIMHIPLGAQGLFVWTEHADRTSLESNYATYYGRSDITRPKDAVGGFVFHNIPVSKSVFYSNAGRLACTKSTKNPQASITGTPGYREFCQDILTRGFEICMHAPDPRDVAPAEAREAAKNLSAEFKACTWIDHMARLVHCGMSAQGMRPASPYYMADAWHAAGFRYFWQFASEDAAETSNLQMTDWGDWMHTPLYWRHPHATQGFISWPTVRRQFLADFNDRNLDALISEWGVCIAHVYPAAHMDPPKESEYFETRENGLLATTRQFEVVLENMAARVKDGKLAVMCMRDVMQYWELTERVEVRYLPDGTTVLTNPTENIIDGFSFAVRGVVEACANAQMVAADADTIVTCDFPPGGAIAISDMRTKSSTSPEEHYFLDLRVDMLDADLKNSPEVAIDLEFGEGCRDENHSMLASARGMIEGGFLSDQSRGEKQAVVASLPLKDYTYGTYISAVRKHGSSNAVREATKASKLGYFVEQFPRALYLPDIYNINTSTAQRGGEPMRAAYRRTVEEMGGAPTHMLTLRPPVCGKHHQRHFGIFRPSPGHMQGAVQTDRELVAYLSVNRYGSLAIYSTLLGHHDHLRDGIMALLHFQTVQALLDPDNEEFRGLQQLMYHRYINANPGLTFWKKKMVFEPVFLINRGAPLPEISSQTENSPGGIGEGAKPETAVTIAGAVAGVGDPFDLRYGIDTKAVAFLKDLKITSPNAKFGLNYQTSHPKVIEDSVRFLAIDPKLFTFIDLGAGKGRTLLQAAGLGFQKVVGVEFAHELVEIARENIDRLGLLNVQVIGGDAAEYIFPPDDLVVYMYNPFQAPVMEAVIDHLVRSLPSDVYILYRNPKCREVLERASFLEYVGCVPEWPGDGGVHVWKTVRH